MDNSVYSISIIMPAFNEENSVQTTTRQNIQTFDSLRIDFELLIIDDKSLDRTLEIAKSLAAQDSRIRCYAHARNLGPGGAFRTGIQNATKDYVIFLPFDNPMDPEDLKVYLTRMGVCDIVVGFRAERVGYSTFARFASFFYNRILVPLLFNVGVSDVNWIQIYRRNLFSEGTITFNDSKIFYLVEILVQARKKHLIIAEVPSRMKKRLFGQPTCTKFSTIVLTLYDMLRFFIKLRKEDY